MVFLNLVQQPIIINQEQNQAYPRTRTGHDDRDSSRYGPISVLGSVHIDQRINEADNDVK